MLTPDVSFVVPCYKLAHLLPECIGSILSQSYENFEVLIMDDCSPDYTAEVASSFKDSRIRYIRNQENLGLIGNFNKGISLSRGKYAWIISADDYLRRSYIVQRYVALMDHNTNVGYVFCPAVSVEDGNEAGIEGYYGKRDRIINGRVFLKDLLQWNRIMAAGAMARRECYEQVSLFPTDVRWAGVNVDFRWAGDWYLWCLFALSFDVAYFSEPMACYRKHELSITTSITGQDNVRKCATADIAVPWLIREKANACGAAGVAKDALLAIAHQYGAHCTSKEYRSSFSEMTLSEFEESLNHSTSSERERKWIRARAFAWMGDKCFMKHDSFGARRFYLLSVQNDWRMPRASIKFLFTFLGKPGSYVRRTWSRLRTLALRTVVGRQSDHGLPDF